MKSGYLYVLVHPSDPCLYKIGVTTCLPEERLAQHNANHQEYAGRIVKETGQKWEIKTYIAVPDPYWAETVFWGATPFSVIPYRGGIEVERMSWEMVQAGLDAAMNAGLRPPPKPLPDYVYAYSAEMRRRLEGRDIELIGNVTSRSGKSTFRCINGHEWRTWSRGVSEGQGCPQCGVGERTPGEIWHAAKLGYLCLLINPDEPNAIKIGATHAPMDKWNEEATWQGWEVHRYRYVEDLALAESLIWDMLGKAPPDNRELVNWKLNIVEQVFRDLIPRLRTAIAEKERNAENAYRLR